MCSLQITPPMIAAKLSRVMCLLFAVMAPAAVLRAQTLADVQQGFLAPPDDARIMMRWWWFGPGVTKPELEREILAMKAGGIGGFEIQPVYPMALDDSANGFHNAPYLSDEFLDDVKFASQTAHANGMRIDMTLASGWPYGGAHVPVDQASACLHVVPVDIPAGTGSFAMPRIGNGESLIATFAGKGSPAQYDPTGLLRMEVQPHNGRIDIGASSEARVAVFYIQSRTGQQVKRAAVGAEGFVLDHYSKAAIDNHLKTVGEPLMKAFGDTPPYAVFSDSLEAYGSNWTDDLLQEFQRRRGYDLMPYLPELTAGTDERSAELRHDWGVTLTELADERYLTPVNDWAAAHHTRFRSQTYGVPPVSMSSNRLVALPEGEGPQWNSFSFTRWATSASHLYGRPITSSETWTWLHSPAFRATPLDMKAEADRFFLEGVNQLIGHGWPYTPPGVAEPGWSFYAAAVFNDHNPWWIVMPDITKYLQRMSYLLRQGKPVNDVAVLLPNDDVYAELQPGKASLSEGMPKYVTPALMQQILSAGYNPDFIDAEAIAQVGIPYPVLVLPHVERLSPQTMKAIVAYTAHGGKVIAVGSMPSRSPGFANAAAVTTEVQSMAQSLLNDKEHAKLIGADGNLGAVLQKTLQPDVQVSSDSDAVGFAHRAMSDADIYFVVNTSNHSVNTTAKFRSTRKFVSVWDAFSGNAFRAAGAPLSLKLAPYESRVIVFSNTAPAEKNPTSPGVPTLLADLTQDWTVNFPADGRSEMVTNPGSWTDDEKTRFYSGVAVYTKTVHLGAKDLAGVKSLTLDFGEGTPVSADPKILSGMRALLESPVREAAVVSVNGQRAGSVWHPPYTLDVSGMLHAGDNTIELRIANTGINLLAGRAPADYHLLNMRYGERFTPQNMEGLEPLPSGLLGPVHLLETR